MKYCSKCGTGLREDALFCFKCGCKAPKMSNLSIPKSTAKIYNSAISQYQEEKNHPDSRGGEPKDLNAPKRMIPIAHVTDYYVQDKPSSYYMHSDEATESLKYHNTNTTEHRRSKHRQGVWGIVAIIVALCGILLNCLLALLGHACGIVGIVLGICAIAKAPKEPKGYVGLGLGILCEIFAIINSIMGANIGAQIGASISSAFAEI